MSAREQICHERRLQRERLWVTGSVYYLPNRARSYQGRAINSDSRTLDACGLALAGLCSFALVLFFFALFTFTLSN